MISGGQERVPVAYMSLSCRSETFTSDIDVNNDGKPDTIQIEVVSKVMPICQIYLLPSGWKNKVFGFPTDSNFKRSYWGGPGKFTFPTDGKIDIGVFWAKGDLVQVPFSSQSNAPVLARVFGLYLEFDPNTKVTRKMVRIDLGNGGIFFRERVDVFPVEAVTLVSKIADLEQKAGPIIDKVKKTHKRDWDRREELLGYADFESLRPSFQAEVITIEKRLSTALDQEIQKLKIDEPGELILLEKIKAQVGIEMRAILIFDLDGKTLPKNNH